MLSDQDPALLPFHYHHLNNLSQSIEYGIARAQRLVGNDCKVFGTIYALNDIFVVLLAKSGWES